MISIETVKNKFTAEIGLVILLCRLHFKSATVGEINEYISSSSIDWNLFYRLVNTHDIRPFIYKIVAIKPLGIDNKVLSRLQQDVLHLSKDNLQRLRELTRLNQVFRDNNTTAVPVKGIVLSYLLYDDFISRETCDIDYFIEPGDFPQVRELLIKQGYSGDSFAPGKLQYLLANTREYKMQKNTPSGPMKIEIQWQPTLNVVDIPLKNTALLTELDTIELAGHTILVMNMQNRFLTLIAHHGVNDIWRNLKHILDIAVLYARYSHLVNWEQFRQQTKQYKLDRTARVGFTIANQLFGTDISVDTDKNLLSVSDEVLNNILKFPLIARRRSFFRNIRQQLKMRDSNINKLQMMLAYVKSVLRRRQYN